MGENSSIIAFAKYFGTNEKNTIHFHGSEENVSAFLMVMEKYSIKRFDAPDFYIKDDRNRIVYIIEHFEIDCYKKGRKGSGFRLDESRIYKTMKELQKEYAYEEYHDIISAETSYDFYINNVIKTFEKHYNHAEIRHAICQKAKKKKAPKRSRIKVFALAGAEGLSVAPQPLLRFPKFVWA